MSNKKLDSQVEKEWLGKDSSFGLDIKLMHLSKYNSIYLKIENLLIRIGDHKWVYEESKKQPKIDIVIDEQQLIKLKNVLWVAYKIKMKKQNIIKYKYQKIFGEK